VAILLVMDCVLVRVAIGREARWGSEEVLEGTNVDSRVECGERSRSG